MDGIGGRLSILVREIVRFRGIESDVGGDGRDCGGGGGGETPVGSDEGRRRRGDYIRVVSGR